MPLKNPTFIAVLTCAAALGAAAWWMSSMNPSGEKLPGVVASIDGTTIEPADSPDGTSAAKHSGSVSNGGKAPAGPQEVLPLRVQFERLAPDGVIRDERLANILSLASSYCTQTIDTKPATSEGEAFDETRAWAVANLIELCMDFDPSKYKLELEMANLTGMVQRQGWDASASTVRSVVANSAMASEIHVSGLLLMENGAFPYDEIMPDMRGRYGQPELMRAWGVSASVLACERAGGCGSSSLQVAALCARLGCQPGQDYWEVIGERMPSSEYRLIVAMTTWARRRP